VRPRDAVEDVVPEKIRVRRIIANEFKGAEYWRHGQWRFVTGPRNGRVLLFTCERRKPEEN
jgi:hypothetical protein